MMNKRKAIIALIIILVAFSLPLIAQKKSLKNLPPKYRKWLEEEVVYIITPKEKDVFLQLNTDREREIFIEAFWKQRDPDPLTPENEFKIEHYKRIAYANQNFGKEGPGAGWRSAMGRTYIVLGQPYTIDRFENESEIYPVIVWFYQGMSEYGLPDSFYVVFFKRSGIGEYELYSPVKDGPNSLMIHYSGDPADYQSAYNAIYNISPTVAEVSMSLIPGESAATLTAPSIASELLIRNKIPQAAYKKVDSTYAEKLLAYKDIIEVDYTANYVSCDAYAEVLKDATGIYFVHYLIEPKKLSLTQVGDRFRANLEINGKVTDSAGRTVYQYQRTVPVELNREQLELIRNKLFSFQDIFALLPGDYRLEVLVKNTISKEFTSMESQVSVPVTDELQFINLILANRLVRGSGYRGQVKPFLVDDLQLVPSPRNDFTSQDTLYLFFQVSGLTNRLVNEGSLEYTIFKEDVSVFTINKPLRQYRDPANILEEFSLASYAPAYYRIKVSLLDGEKKEVLSAEENFLISYLAQLARPWVLSIPQPPATDPFHANILGNQYLQKNNLARARDLLGDAYRRQPNEKQFALDYGNVLIASNEYQIAREVSRPFLNSPDRPDFLLLYAQTCQGLGELNEAIIYYKEYLAHFGTNINVLNSIGECYYQLGELEEALVAWEKSLELSPKQEKIKALVESIKKKK